MLDQAGAELSANTLASLDNRASELLNLIRRERASTVREIVQQVTVASDRLTITLIGEELLTRLSARRARAATDVQLVAQVELRRTGRAVQLVQQDGRAASANIDTTLVELVIRARRWRDEIVASGMTISQFAKRENINSSFVSRTIRLAYLSPRIVEAIADGRQPAALTTDRLRRGDVPLRWSDQHDLFGL